MGKRTNCTACTFQRNGVKTRKHIPHTCGIELRDNEKKQNYEQERPEKKFQGERPQEGQL